MAKELEPSKFIVDLFMNYNYFLHQSYFNLSQTGFTKLGVYVDLQVDRDRFSNKTA